MYKEYYCYEELDSDTLLCLLNQYKNRKLYFNGCNGLVLIVFYSKGDNDIYFELKESYFDDKEAFLYDLECCDAFIFDKDTITSDKLVSILLQYPNLDISLVGSKGLHIFINDEEITFCDTDSETVNYYYSEYIPA